jgi:hypothetical protein
MAWFRCSEVRTTQLVVAELASTLVLAACGGGGGGGSPPAVVEQPPAGTSRIAAIEYDADLDGVADQVARYTYDDAGRLVEVASYAVVDGVESTTAQQSTVRRIDAPGRVLQITSSHPGFESVLDADYGTDGRLARTTQTFGTSNPVVTTYTWDGARLTGYAVSGSSPTTATLLYGDDGRVARVERTRSGETDVDGYTWRADGQLATASFNEAVGRLVLYQLLFDDQGLRTELRRTDDGFADAWLRFAHDTNGRVERIDIGELPDFFDDGSDFVARARHRVVWEDGLCQPVWEPVPLPLVDFAITGEASATGASLVCAGRA